MRKNDFILDRANAELDSLVRESVNQFLTEKFFGKCWHDPYPSKIFRQCQKCLSGEKNIDLFTPNGFFILWEKAQKEEWWDRFIIESDWPVDSEKDNNWIDYIVAINRPITFPILLAEFLGWKEGE